MAGSASGAALVPVGLFSGRREQAVPASCSGPSFSGSLFPGQPWLQPHGLLPLVLSLRLVATLAPLPLPPWGSVSARLAVGHLWSGYRFFRLTSPCSNRWCVFCLLARSWRTQPDFAQSKTLKPLSPRRGTDSNSGHRLLDLPQPLAPPRPAPNASSSSHFQHFLPHPFLACAPLILTSRQPARARPGGTPGGPP